MSHGPRVVLVAVVVVAAGCGGAVKRTSYVGENLALLNSVPAYPGARLVSNESHPYTQNEMSSATAGYMTSRVESVGHTLRSRAVIAFYRRVLASGEWRVVSVSAAPALSFRRGDAYLDVLTGNGSIYIEVDHDCYKGGPTPRCG